MTKFEEEITWILGDFKKEILNYAETIIKIEELITHILGFSMERSKMIDEIMKDKKP